MRPSLARLAAATIVATAVASSSAAAQQQQQQSAASTRQAPSAATPPTLIVFITVDQLRPDYFTRFGDQLTGGLGRLYRGGAVFTDAYQDHAITETAPGHASTLSGRFPRSTGIVTNTAGVWDPQAPLLGAHGGPDSENGSPASPFRFRGTTLTDWLRISDPRTRALSVSRKDRGAILPMGRAKQSVFWYDPEAPPGPNGATYGGFTTSHYYDDTLPSWVATFNLAHPIGTYAGRVWTPLLAANAYPEPDTVRSENGGKDFTFPHALPRDARHVAWELPYAPWMDELTLALALAGERALGLGLGPQTDVLAVSLSTTDAVGHRYGPDSRELHDQILRLDRALGAFLDSLYREKDSTRIVVALTADHGVAPYPGVARSADSARRPAGGAKFLNAWTLAASTRAALLGRGVDTAAFRFADGVLQVDRPSFARARVDVDSVVRAFAAELRRTPGVMRAETMAEVARRDTTRDVIARRWMHMIPPDLDVALVVTPQPYFPWGDASYANHGSPHDYDAHVPVIFYGAPFKPGHYDRLARVVDIAPTLAAVAGVPPTERLDGRVLQEALR
jgi:predicted AlkP superfamily pyrophosphatase or phosphodiesterase